MTNSQLSSSFDFPIHEKESWKRAKAQAQGQQAASPPHLCLGTCAVVAPLPVAASVPRRHTQGHLFKCPAPPMQVGPLTKRLGTGSAADWGLVWILEYLHT